MLETHFDRVKAMFKGDDVRIEKMMEKTETPMQAIDLALEGAVQKGGRGIRLQEYVSAGLLAAVRFTLRRSSHTYSVEGLKGSPAFDEVIRTLFSGEEAAAATAIGNHRFIAWHELGGQRVYEVSPGLTQQLQDTELRGLNTEDLKLPYPAIYIQLPKAGEHDLYIANDRTQPPVEGFYLVEDNDRKEGRCWHVMVAGRWPREGQQSPLEDVVHFFRIVLPPGKSIDEALELSRQDMEKWNLIQPSKFALMNAWGPLFRFAMNVVVYATWGDAERENIWRDKEAQKLSDRMQKAPKGSTKREKLRQELRERDTRVYTYLGRSSRAEPRESMGTGLPLELRVRVQGHWRNQAHGPGHSLRKLIWILPFWKGPEDGAFGTNIHKLT